MPKKDSVLKAVVSGYNPPPFYFRQKYSDGNRIAAWTPNLAQLKELFYSILATYPEDSEILLKIAAADNPDEFNRFYGKAKLSRLVEKIKHNETFIFSDGNHQFCIKRPDTGEYIALDDHDILFIYSDSKEMLDICKKNGFHRKKTKLICSAGHWHVSPKYSGKLTTKFIRELQLMPVK